MPSRYHESKLALGSDTTLCIVGTLDASGATDILRQLWLEIYKFERQFSRFIPESELSQFNRSAGTRYSISPEFRDILLAARKIAHKTDGLYNPFILPALQKSGYLRSQAPGYQNDQTDDYRNRSVVAPDALKVGEAWAEIPYGTAIDLGGCGKGYLGDKLTKLPILNDLDGFWLSLGGDIVGRGVDENMVPWRISIQGLGGPGSNAGYACKSSGEPFAIATSGTHIRTGKKGLRSWHHLIDPCTLRPAKTDIVQATVLAPQCIDADVLASCAVIAGSRSAPSLMHRLAATDYLLLPKTGKPIHYGTHIQPI